MSTVSVEIKGKDNLSPAVHKARSSMDSLKGSAHSLIDAFNPMMIAGAGVALAITKISSTVTKLVTEFGESERMAVQLQTALGGSAGAFDRMSAMIGQMATKTMGSKDELEALVGQMASLGKSESEIEKITDATIALSNVTGQSLDAAFKAINGTYVGTTKELKKLVPEIGDLTKEQLAAGGAVDILNRKLGEISDAMAGGISQRIKNLSDGFGDLRENIGERMLTAFSPMLTFIDSVIGKWNEAFDAQKRYRDALNADDPILAAAIKRLNDIKKQIGKEEQRLSSARADASGIMSTDTGALASLQYQQLSAQKAYDDLMASRRQQSPALAGAPPQSAGTTAAAGSPEEPAHVIIDKMDMIPMGIVNPSQSQENGGSDIMGDMNPLSLLGDLFMNIAGPLQSVMTLMDPMGEILKGIMDVVGPLIDTLLTPLIGILRIVGQTIGKLLVPVLELLGPIITAIAKLFVFMYNNVVRPIYNTMMTVFNLIYNGFAAFVNGILWLIDQIPFVDVGRVAYRNLDAGHLDEITLEDVSKAGEKSAGTGTSGSSASYAAARDITVNVSVTTSALVGEGGIQQFALIIGRELKSAGVLGVA